MKIKTLLLLLAVCILPVVYAGVVFSPDTLGAGKLYRDSTYRRVIKEGTANLDCYFSIRRGAGRYREVTAAMPVNWRDWISSCVLVCRHADLRPPDYPDRLLLHRRQLCRQRKAGARPCQRFQKLPGYGIRAGKALSGGSALRGRGLGQAATTGGGFHIARSGRNTGCHRQYGHFQGP